MKLRFGPKSGEPVPAPDQALKEIQASLAQQQKLWAEPLARDPAAFAQLGPQIHLAFQQLADRCAASLLAHSASTTAKAPPWLAWSPGNPPSCLPSNWPVRNWPAAA